ncbi:MAG TPA: molecular chaperone HscC [Pseudomonadota bacterium]|jgi:molecular chaperone HscC|nr:molecular chaperone HscC [Pseudomonadota bacterium]
MIVGIDLGTTNSLIGYIDQGQPRLIPNAFGEVLTPSVVAVDEAGKVLVGQAARERLIRHPEATVATFKRWMGSDRETRLGTHRFRPEELSALVLKALVADAEAALGERIVEAVISVPAYFSDAQRKATKAAGEIAGLKVERLINEPTAAALAYGLQQGEDGSHFLVLDLGGGTFDVSILEMFSGVMEVHASAGDNFLGGEDFVDVLEADALRAANIDARTIAPEQRARLRDLVERVKRQLGSEAELQVELPFEGAPRWSIGEARFADLAQPLVARMRQPVERALRDARLQPGDLREIVLVGGASRMPLVARLATRMFGRLPLRNIHPDQAIALGASVAAGMKARNEAFRDVVLTDVCPYTLGVEVAERDAHGHLHQGLFSPLIERNTIVPVSREGLYNPIEDNQQQLNLRVYQGESPRVANNIKLGELDIRLPRAKAHENAVRVRFTYDIDGLLQVEAEVLATQQRHELVIERNPGVLSQDEIKARLAKLSGIKIHPREDQLNLAVVARAERIYEERLGDQRRIVGEQLAAFFAVIETQDRTRIDRAREALQQFLDQIEQQSPSF